MEQHEGTGGVIAVLLLVALLAAMVEVDASRAVAPTVPPPGASSWEASVRMADEALAHGDAPAARRAYLITLFRARGERSLPGVVPAAEGFATLGDDAVVAEALQMAAWLGTTDADADTRVRLQALRQHRDAPAALPIAVRPPR